MSNVTSSLDSSTEALNWATLAQSIFNSLGILLTALFVAIQHIRQAISDAKQAQLIAAHADLHTKVDGLTPANSPSASTAQISNDELIVKKDK